MVHMALPKNSRVQKGKVWPKPADTSKLTEFNIYRWSPDDDQNPRLDRSEEHTSELQSLV